MKTFQNFILRRKKIFDSSKKTSASFPVNRTRAILSPAFYLYMIHNSAYIWFLPLSHIFFTVPLYVFCRITWWFEFYITLREKHQYSEFFWSVFFRIWTEYRPEKLRIRTHFTQCWMVNTESFLVIVSWMQ